MLACLAYLFVLTVGPPALLVALKLMGLPVRFDLESWFGAFLLVLFFA